MLGQGSIVSVCKDAENKVNRKPGCIVHVPRKPVRMVPAEAATIVVAFIFEKWDVFSLQYTRSGKRLGRGPNGDHNPELTARIGVHQFNRANSYMRNSLLSTSTSNVASAVFSSVSSPSCLEIAFNLESASFFWELEPVNMTKRKLVRRLLTNKSAATTIQNMTKTNNYRSIQACDNCDKQTLKYSPLDFSRGRHY